MRVNTWTEYSLIIAIHLARRERAGQGRTSARDLALAERLPADYTEQILLRLRRAGLVESTRGAHGGYRIARRPESISIRDLMNAAEHQTFEVNCDVHPIDAERCNPARRAPSGRSGTPSSAASTRSSAVSRSPTCFAMKGRCRSSWH